MKKLESIKINNLNACGLFGLKEYVMEIKMPKDAKVKPYMKAFTIELSDNADNRVWAYGLCLSYSCYEGKLVAEIAPEDIVEMNYVDYDPDVVDTGI